MKVAYHKPSHLREPAVHHFQKNILMIAKVSNMETTQNRDELKINYYHPTIIQSNHSYLVCVCVCVCERERERERDSLSTPQKLLFQ